eukprot:5655625-Prorocentrum_lima.AAC.1
MTSSLVGSEMCIRDSVYGMVDLRKALVKNYITSRWALTAKRDKQGNFPVSYTHLTLPTICSV